MNLEVITNLIGSLGFPIACCCVMFHQNGKLQETLSEVSHTLVSMNERLNEIEQSVKKGDVNES